MNRQGKISRIYTIIADKSVTYGCYLSDSILGKLIYLGINSSDKTSMYALRANSQNKSRVKIKYYDKGVIGHPVMLGDVLEWLDKGLPEEAIICNPNTLKVYGKPEMRKGYKHHHENCYIPVNNVTIIAMGLFDALADEIIHNRKNKRTPIDEQSDECIEYIYNLINQGKN